MLKKIIYQILILSFVFLTSAQSAETGGMPQLNPEFWISQIVWLVITFGILFIVLSKFILPKISDNLETRKSQILENIENAEKQREESEKKLKEFDKIIVESKKKAALEKIIDDEINAAEQEIDQLKKSSHEKITKIAIETSSDLVKKLIGEEVNNSSISAIVEDLSKKNKEKINGI